MSTPASVDCFHKYCHSSHDFHETVPRTMSSTHRDCRPRIKTARGHDVKTLLSWAKKKRLRAELCHASDKEQELELYCFFELRQIKQIQTHRARSPWSVLLEVSGLQLPWGRCPKHQRCWCWQPATPLNLSADFQGKTGVQMC